MSVSRVRLCRTELRGGGALRAGHRRVGVNRRHRCLVEGLALVQLGGGIAILCYHLANLGVGQGVTDRHLRGVQLFGG